MDTQQQTELEQWEDLLKSPGFRMLIQHANLEWCGTGYGRKMKAAVDAARKEDRDPALAIETIHGISDAVTTLMGYPEMRMQQLTTPTQSRPFWDKRRA